ncbi:AraC family transcriptional regulator [Dyadobacter sp. CY323]|uniref:helix-turn-helix domain-containing protein n=1 Tax=Dyadobacter sp. CY323 TaxID=2907302 RepID=UPI001F3F2F49|nr:helix-turn-helix domain-containing protein [Dyadobacter sp. CY323]MCE6992199.1 helix-turn-helix domain-containing protein [Dyadobacter sp. CY323]
MSLRFAKLVSALLTSGIIQGLLLILLLVKKEFNRIPNRILSVLILVVTAHLSLIAIDVDDLFLQYPHLSRLSWLLPLLYGPLILLLTESLVSVQFSFKTRHAFYFLPFVIYFFLLAPYYASGADFKIAYLSDQAKVKEADFGWMNHLTNYFHLAFTSAALIVFYSGRRKLTQYFSDSIRINLSWLRQFLWIFLSILLFSLLTFYSKKFEWQHLSGIYPKHFILAVLFIYWLAYKLLQEKVKFTLPEKDSPGKQENEELESKEEPQSKYSKTGLDADTASQIAEKLQDLMQKDRPYLDPALTISDLSAMLSLSKHKLSQVINAEFDMNFYEFINNYRLQAFKKEALNPNNSHLSILGIALECGFNSKATFNQFFKKKEGITPSEFLKSSRVG